MKPLKTVMILLALVCVNTPFFSQEYSVGNHELFIMPTADMLPKGKHCLADYELFLFKYTYAATNSTHIGVLLPFPVTADMFEYVTLHIKQRYINHKNFKSAAWLTFTIKDGFYTLGNVFTLNIKKTSLNAGFSIANVLKEGGDPEFIIMAGIRQQISRKVSLVAEYTNFSTLIEEDFNGIITFGARLHLGKFALDFGAFRPLEHSEGLFLFPYLKATLILN